MSRGESNDIPDLNIVLMSRNLVKYVNKIKRFKTFDKYLTDKFSDSSIDEISFALFYLLLCKTGMEKQKIYDEIELFETLTIPQKFESVCLRLCNIYNIMEQKQIEISPERLKEFCKKDSSFVSDILYKKARDIVRLNKKCWYDFKWLW